MSQNDQNKDEKILPNGETLGIVGAGKLSEALVLPLIRKGLLPPHQVIVSGTSDGTLSVWRELGCATTEDNKSVTSSSDIVLWDVEPVNFSNAIPDSWNLTAENYSKSTSLHISILSGITLETFKKSLADGLEVPTKRSYNLRCVRAIPNIGASVESGCVVYTPEPEFQDEDRKFVRRFFGSTGLHFEVPEYQMNAYAGLMCSGIGLMFPVLEALAFGGAKMGIPKEASLKLAAQAMKSAGELLLAEDAHPGDLKDRFCPPRGAAMYGISALEENGIRNAFIKAIEASTKHGQEWNDLNEGPKT